MSELVDQEIDFRPYIEAIIGKWYWILGFGLLAGILAFKDFQDFTVRDVYMRWPGRVERIPDVGYLCLVLVFIVPQHDDVASGVFLLQEIHQEVYLARFRWLHFKHIGIAIGDEAVPPVVVEPYSWIAALAAVLEWVSGKSCGWRLSSSAIPAAGRTIRNTLTSWARRTCWRAARGRR